MGVRVPSPAPAPPLFDQRPGDRGGDLRVDLVGADLEQRLVDRDLVADLLRALESGRWWWIGYALASAAAIYSHYTGIFVLFNGPLNNND